MGNTHSNVNARMAGMGNLVAEVGNDVQYDRSIGSSRFLRAVRARHKHGPVMIKMFVKPDPSMSLKSLVKQIRIERESLADLPNVLTYQKVVETERAGYLIRQWLHSNLYDRISTRPFLSSIEKKWITYQLLCAMRDAHGRKIPHGDLKCENILVTNSLMVYVTDFASSFKPTMLPLDDPSDFSFFFDTSARRSCYLAPERFYEADADPNTQRMNRNQAAGVIFPPEDGSQADLLGMGKRNGKITEAMDVFSLGCVIAELWRDGAPTFTLSQLFRYRDGMFDIDALLVTIADASIRDLVRSMICLDPTQRKSFDELLTQSYGTTFPASFFDFLHQYLVDLQRTSPTLLRQDEIKSAASADGNSSASVASASAESTRHDSAQRSTSITECDERIEKLYEEWFTIVDYFDRPGVDVPKDKAGQNGTGIFSHLQPRVEADSDGLRESGWSAEAADSIFPVHLHIPGLASQELELNVTPLSSDGTAQLILSVILANIRNCLRPSSKCHALDLLLHLSSKWLTDETKLDRVLPYVISLFDDDSAQVRMAAVRSCVQTLMLVKIVTPSNASIFSEYIMPNIKHLSLDPSTPVRCTFASCIVPLAQTGERFLQMAQAMRAEGLFAVEKDHNGNFVDNQPDESNYDVQLRIFQGLLQEVIVTLLTDPSASVKRALISNIAPLCSFFGMAKTNDVLLSHMITYLNDRKWLLREAFFNIIVEVATISGNRSVEEYILPLMTQALSDSEEHVVYQVFNGLRAMIEKNLFDRGRILTILEMTLGFLCHPNIWLREATAGLIASAAQKLEQIDVWTVLYPSVRPLLRSDVHVLNELNLLDFAKRPLSRPVYSAALAWAAQANNSAFWKAVPNAQGAAGLKNSLATEGIGLLLGHTDRNVLKTANGRTEEDDNFLDRLRTIGLEDEDISKLVALRSVIRRLAKQGSKASFGQVDWITPNTAGVHGQANPGHPKAVTEMQSLDGTTPLTIFFTTKTDGKPTTDVSDTASVRTGTVHSHGDESFSTQMAKRRLLGHRTSSEGSQFNPMADIRRRMAAVNLTQSPYSSFSTKLTDLPEEHRLPEQNQDRAAATPPNQSPIVAGQGPTSPLSSHAQARLGVGKATAAVAPSTLTATGTMTDASTRGRKVLTTEASHKATPTGSRAPTIKDVGPDGTPTVGDNEATTSSFTSTYDGSDPYVRAHLEAVYFKNFRDRPEFGPKISSGPLRRRTAAQRANASALSRAATSSTSKRRPEGRLIAYFTEHTGPITCLAVSPDHVFFVSGSQDGTLKVWDTARLEKNVTSRSRVTYNAHKGAITCVIAIEASHCVVSTAMDGSLHVWRIDVSQSTSSVPRYAKPKLVSNFQLSTPEEYATCLVQSNTETSSSLILGTSHSRLTVLDLRTMQVLQTLQNPIEYGPITCLCVDKKKAWLIVGSLAGIVTLWDLRFGLRLKAWRVRPEEGRVALQSKVNRIAIHPSKGRGRWILVAYESSRPAHDPAILSTDQAEVVVETWDIDRGIRVETFEVDSDANPRTSVDSVVRTSKLQPAVGSVSTTEDTTSSYGAPGEPSGLKGAAAAIERLLQQPPSRRVLQDDNDEQLRSSTHSPRDADQKRTQISAWSSTSAVRALFVSLEGYTSSSLAQPSKSAPSGAMEGTESMHPDSAGWLDVGKVNSDVNPTSARKAGPSSQSLASAAASSGPGGYMITAGSDARLRFWDLGRPEKSLVFGVPPLILPSTGTSSSSSSASATHTFTAVETRSEFRTVPAPTTGKATRVVHSTTSGEATGVAQTRLKSPLLPQQNGLYGQMSKTHKDAITDVVLIESPFRCIVASDRSGCLRVWE